MAGTLSFVVGGITAFLAGLCDGSLTMQRWTAWRPADGLPSALLACAVYAYWNKPVASISRC